MRLPLSGHSFLVRFAILGTFALFFGRGVGVVSAEVVHQIRFAQGPRVIVWEGQAAPITAQSITVKANFIETTPKPLAGRLEPIQVSAPIGSVSTSQKTFRVASNAPFAIQAQANVGTAQAGTPIRFAMTALGPNAQDPGDGAVSADNLTLGDLATPQIIYQATRRTAARRGSTASQAVEFTVNWPETEAATVTFTIYIPEN